jgi:predicted kinase
MSKQLIFVSGSPFSGRTTWVKKNLLDDPIESVECIDANNYPSLYTNSKTSEDAIEASRQWCLQEVSKLMGGETPTQKIVLCLIACRADRWREFIQLAVDNEYQISFRFPSNKLLFYVTKHNSSMEQYKFIESKMINKYPRDKKEIMKKDAKNPNEVVYKETNESTLLRNIVTEFESGYAFYLQNRMKLGINKEEWLKTINDHYKVTISNNVKRAQKKAEKEAQEVEKAQYKAEKEARKLAREAEEQQRKLDEENEEEQYEQPQSVMVA